MNPLPRALSPDDEAAIQDILRQMNDGWRNGDGQAYAAPFAEDADYITAPGERVEGRRGIAESHQRIFESFFKGTRLAGRMRSLRCIAPGVVIVQMEGAVLFPGESDDAVPANGFVSLVILKEAGAWRIIHFQNTPTGRWRNLRFLLRFLRSRVWPRRQDVA
jgi:uncharacterized protein (TIGR02246 family)